MIPLSSKIGEVSAIKSLRSSLSKMTTYLLFKIYWLFGEVFWWLVQVKWVQKRLAKMAIEQRLQSEHKISKLAKNWQNDGASDRKWIYFYCSSAGEYEQVKPLLQACVNKGKNPLIIFFSNSGYKFAKLRHETVPFILCQFDRLSFWQYLCSTLPPSHVIVNRHELWPGFLYSTKKHQCILSLVNAQFRSDVRRFHLPKMWIDHLIKRALVSFFDNIFTVSTNDVYLAKKNYGVNPLTQKIVKVGDSKFDRVKGKKFTNSESDTLLLSKLRNIADKRKILVLGSAWEDDFRVYLGSIRKCKEQFLHEWIVFVVFHEPDMELVRKACHECSEIGLVASKLSSLSDTMTMQAAKHAVIFVDQVGILGDLYRFANAAFVGGAMHNKVHNVLEPACFNLPIAHGPNYLNSREAIGLVENGLSQVIVNYDDFATWWQQLGHNADSDSCAQYIADRIGASEKIADSLWQS